MCEELSAKLKIPIDYQILERITDDNKEYRVTKIFDRLEEISAILVDDIITDGITKLNIIKQRQKSIVSVDLIVSLGKTDHNKISLM